MMGSMDSDVNITDIVDSLEKVIKSVNPHLKGRLIAVTDVDGASESFKIMKRVRCTMYYFNPDTKKKTTLLTVQEILRIPSDDKTPIMKEFAKRFLTTAFMWTSSQIYNDLVNGKFECEQPSDSSGVS